MMTSKLCQIFPARQFLVILVSLSAKSAFAFGVPATLPGSFWNKQTTRLGINLINYSGEEEMSFSGKKGFGGTVSTETGSKLLSFVGQVRAEMSTAKAYFDDAGTSRNLNYEFLMAEAALGLKLGLMPTVSFCPYITANGVLGLASLTFNSNSITDLKRSQSSNVFGYEVGAGVDLEFRRDKGKKFIVWGEARSRVLGGDLADQSRFSLDGLTLSLGIGW